MNVCVGLLAATPVAAGGLLAFELSKFHVYVYLVGTTELPPTVDSPASNSIRLPEQMDLSLKAFGALTPGVDLNLKLASGLGAICMNISPTPMAGELSS